MSDMDGRAGAPPGSRATTDGARDVLNGVGLFVVRAVESCCEPLAGRGTLSYASGPQPFEAARSLVALLSGRNQVEEILPGEYVVAVAGGRRTITLEAAR